MYPLFLAPYVEQKRDGVIQNAKTDSERDKRWYADLWITKIEITGDGEK